MKLESFKANSNEIFIDAGKMSVTVNTWSNCEGASIMVHGEGPGLPLRMAGAFRWEEIDVIIAGMAAARAV
jgi:hypothetical protein